MAKAHLPGNERTLRPAETMTASGSGFCSGHSDEFVASLVYDNGTSEPVSKPSWNACAEHSLVGQPRRRTSQDTWSLHAAKPGKSTSYLNVDDGDEDISGQKYNSPEFPLAREENGGCASGAVARDMGETFTARRSGKNQEPRDQETQTLHETAPPFLRSAEMGKPLMPEMSHRNQSPTVNLPVGNSFHLLPTLIPVPSDHSGACFVSPTLGYQVNAASHPQFAQVPTTTHVIHPRAGQDQFVYLPSHIYSHHLQRTVPTVYASHVPPNATTATVRSPSAMPVILAPGRVAFNRPPAPAVVPNFAIPATSFATSSPGSAMRYNQSVANAHAYRRYLMGPGGHVTAPMYQYTGFVGQ